MYSMNSLTLIVATVTVIPVLLLADENDREVSLLQQMRKATIQTGNEYVKTRDELISKYIKKPESFSNLSLSSDDWEARLLLEIIKMRARNEALITKLENIKNGNSIFIWNKRW